MSAPTDTTWRGFSLIRSLCQRGFLPLLDPNTGAITLYRFACSAQLSDRELADIWLERAAIGEYLRGLAV